MSETDVVAADPEDPHGEQALADAKQAILDQTAAGLSAHAQHVAADVVRSRIRNFLKPYLPRFLHPLLPGVGGSVVERASYDAKRWISRAFWGAVTTVIFTMVFAALFGGAFVFAIVIVYMSLPG